MRNKIIQARAFRNVVTTAVLGLLCASTAAGQAVVPVALSTVADSTLAIPGGTGTFTSFDPGLVGLPPSPCASDGNVAFWGGGSGGQQGVYALLSGTPTQIASLNTLIPSGTGDFVNLPPSPCISGTNVVLIGNGSGGQQGVYAALNGTLTRIADTSTAIPSGTGDFAAFGSFPAISGANVAFAAGNGSTQNGVYRCLPPNPCTPVADTNTAIPGGTGNFSFFSALGQTIGAGVPDQAALALSGTNVAFIGGGSVDIGVYACLPPNPCTPVANNNTKSTVPGLPGSSYIYFITASLSGTSVAFNGLSSPNGAGGKDMNEGVYVGLPPNPCVAACSFSLSAVADTTMAVPGASGNFSGFGNVVIDPANVVFEGFSASVTKGIYASIGGSLIKIVADGDSLGGKTVSDVHLGPGGFSGNQVVFEAAFTDGSRATVAGTFTSFIRCPQSQGFWKNHTSQWPVTTLVLGNQNYSMTQLLALLGTPSTSDASLVLARQLIAAKLNIANFSDPAPINSSIADADSRLSTFTGKLPYGVKSGTAMGTGMENDATVLENYNSDQLTPGCIP